MTRYRQRASVIVAAPPERVWERVTDLTRMGDASPVCTGCDWEDPGTGFVEGAWFTGHNAAHGFTWSTRCRIVDVVPGRSFAFVSYGNGDIALVRWGYEVEPTGDGTTELSETWQILPEYPSVITKIYPDRDLATMLADREQVAREGMPATLAALKAELES